MTRLTSAWAIPPPEAERRTTPRQGINGEKVGEDSACIEADFPVLCLPAATSTAAAAAEEDQDGDGDG